MTHETTHTESNSEQTHQPRLLPCPLLGHLPSKDEWPTGPYIAVSGAPDMPKFYAVVCPNCCSTAYDEDKERVIRKWNSRISANSAAPVVDEAQVSYGVQVIAKERQRHFDVEGWWPEHDDEHEKGELAQAAACYAWPSPRPLEVKKAWPWEPHEWKPELYGVPGASEQEKREARIRVLVKAGALVAAEIDRLARIDGGGITPDVQASPHEFLGESRSVPCERCGLIYSASVHHGTPVQASVPAEGEELTTDGLTPSEHLFSRLLHEQRKWYSEEIFSPWTLEEAQKVHAKFPGAVDRVAAESARRVIDRISADIRSGKYRTWEDNTLNEFDAAYVSAATTAAPAEQSECEEDA